LLVEEIATLKSQRARHCEFFMSSKLLLEEAFGKGAAPADHAQRFADTLVQFLVDGARQR